MRVLRKILKAIDRYIVVFLLLSLTCGVVGQYMMSWDYLWAEGVDPRYLSEYADPAGKIIAPLEPLARGLKVVGGYDSYVFRENDFHSVWQRIGFYVFEVGRWVGFVVYLRTMIWLVQASFTTLDSERKANSAIKKGERVIAVHGDSLYAATLVKNLAGAGYVVTVSEPKLVPLLGENAPSDAASPLITLKAPIQVIMYEKDADSLSFLEQNGSRIPEDSHIYVRLDDIVPSGVLDGRVEPFSIAQICAELYWSKHPIFLTYTNGKEGELPDPVAFAGSLSKPLKSGPRYRVVIIGDTDLTERILEVALLTNISNITGGIRYDVIGDLSSWRKQHPQMDAAVQVNCDELHFHEGAWYDHRELLLASDRVIVCGRSSDNVRIASELQNEPLRRLHVRASSASSLLVLGVNSEGETGPKELEIFATVDEVSTTTLILQDNESDRGMISAVIRGLGTSRCNGCGTFDFAGIGEVSAGGELDDALRQQVRDARLTRILETDEQGLNKCLACPHFTEAWSKMDGFTHRQSYADASHTCQKYRLLYLFGVPMNLETSVVEQSRAYYDLPDEAKEAMREIEHIRWSRFCFLNGWRYAEGPIDPRMRTSPNLVSYGMLASTFNKSKYDDGYLNLCRLNISSEELQMWLDSVWLADEGAEGAGANEVFIAALDTLGISVEQSQSKQASKS